MVAAAIWLILHITGLLVIAVRHRPRELCLLVLPLFVMLVFNGMGFWPFGFFRANLFAVAYLGPIAALSFDRDRRRVSRAWALVPALVLLVIPMLFFEDGWPRTKRGFTQTSAFPKAIVWLAKQVPTPPPPSSPPRASSARAH